MGNGFIWAYRFTSITTDADLRVDQVLLKEDDFRCVHRKITPSTCIKHTSPRLTRRGGAGRSANPCVFNAWILVSQKGPSSPVGHACVLSFSTASRIGGMLSPYCPDSRSAAKLHRSYHSYERSSSTTLCQFLRCAERRRSHFISCRVAASAHLSKEEVLGYCQASSLRSRRSIMVVTVRPTNARISKSASTPSIWNCV